MKRSPLLVIFVTVFIDLVSFGIVIPLLPFYAQQFGASGMVIGLLLSVFSLMTFLWMPLLGRFSDRYGRRPVILITVAGSVIAYIIFSFAQSLAMLFAARILSGMANSNLSVAQAYIADVTPPEKRAKGMGIVGAAFGLGFIFGPLISAVFSTDYFGAWRFTMPGLVAAFLSLLNLALAYFMLPESLPPERRVPAARHVLVDWKGLRDALKRPGLGLVILLLGVVTLAFSNIFVSLPLFVKEAPFGLSSSELSWIFAEIGIVGAVIQGGLIGRLTAAFGERRLVVSGTILLSIGFIGFPISAWLPSGNLIFLGLTTAVLSIGSSCLTPSLMSLASRFADPAEQGSVLGMVQSFASLARMAGPIVGGVAYDVAGHTSPYYFSFLTTVVGVVMAVRLMTRRAVRI